MGIIKRSLVIMLLIVASLSASAQMEKVHAAFIYNFTKYMEWPVAHRQGDFVIGVIRNPDMVAALNAMIAGKLVGMQKITVKSFDSVNSISDCHMFYLPSKLSNQLGDLVSKINGKKSVIISCRNGLSKKGADINFIISNQKQGFEINKTGINNKGIILSSKLEQLAVKVY